MDLKACIFDLDGVIVDTARYHYLAWAQLADQIGVDFNESINEQLKGVSRMTSLQMILDRSGFEISQKEKEDLAEQKNKWFIEMVNRMTSSEILPGIETFLVKLEKEGIRKAVGSASKNARLALQKTGLLDRFEIIVDGTMVQKAKPDPEVFMQAARKLGINPQNCIVFEDAIAGVKAAHNGGMKCIGIGKKDDLSEADLVIKSFEHINLEQVRRIL